MINISKDVFPRHLRPLLGCEQINNFPLFLQKSEIRYSRNVKLLTAITYVLQKRESSGLHTAGEFWQWRIEWCDRHLFHVTGSDHAH